MNSFFIRFFEKFALFVKKKIDQKSCWFNWVFVLECIGTSNKFSTVSVGADNSTKEYHKLKMKYSKPGPKCTRIYGNLEINGVDKSERKPGEVYDFEFLSEVKEISGYLLIYNVNLDELVLPNLVIVRGNELLECESTKVGKCALYILDKDRHMFAFNHKSYKRSIKLTWIAVIKRIVSIAVLKMWKTAPNPNWKNFRMDVSFFLLSSRRDQFYLAEMLLRNFCLKTDWSLAPVILDLVSSNWDTYETKIEKFFRSIFS